MGKTSIWPLVWLNIRKWKNNYRVWIVFLIEFSYMWISTYEYKLQAVANHLAVSGGFFAIWSSTKYGRFLMFLGIIVLFCNAPFKDEHQTYLIIRSGKRKWMIGQCLYIFLASLIYFSVMMLFCILRYFPYINLENKWGDVIYTVASNRGVINNEILTTFTPMQACAQCFIICVLLGFLHGIFILYINLYKKGTLGVWIAITNICLSFFITDFFTEKTQFLFLKYAILEWCDLKNYVNKYQVSGLSLEKNIGIIIGVSIVLLILIRRKWRREGTL